MGMSLSHQPSHAREACYEQPAAKLAAALSGPSTAPSMQSIVCICRTRWCVWCWRRSGSTARRCMSSAGAAQLRGDAPECLCIKEKAAEGCGCGEAECCRRRSSSGRPSWRHRGRRARRSAWATLQRSPVPSSCTTQPSCAINVCSLSTRALPPCGPEGGAAC